MVNQIGGDFYEHIASRLIELQLLMRWVVKQSANASTERKVRIGTSMQLWTHGALQMPWTFYTKNFVHQKRKMCFPHWHVPEDKSDPLSHSHKSCVFWYDHWDKGLELQLSLRKVMQCELVCQCQYCQVKKQLEFKYYYREGAIVQTKIQGNLRSEVV